MDITVRVSKDELNFIREALFNYYEELDNRFLEAEENLMESISDSIKPIARSSENKQTHNYAWKAVAPEEVSKPKKPHWTQTPEGKKIMARRSKNRSKK